MHIRLSQRASGPRHRLDNNNKKKLHTMYNNVNVRLLESADDLNSGLFVVTARQLRTVSEERVVNVHRVVLHHAVLRRLNTYSIIIKLTGLAR